MNLDIDRSVPNGTEPVKRTVLLVEDDATLRQLIGGFLEKSGFRVLSAANGDLAVLLSSQHPHPFDLMVTDIVMPGMSGPDLMRTLRETRPGLAVLFISGYDAELAASIPRERTISFLAKPFTPGMLASKIDRLLGNAEDALSVSA